MVWINFFDGTGAAQSI